MIEYTIILFIILFIFQFYFLKVNIINSILTSIIVSIFPYLIYNAILNKIEKEKEEMFIKFVLDLAHLLKSGLTLPVALKELERTDYKILNPLIRNLSARIDWGTDLVEAFEYFAEESDSKTIKRVIKIVLDIYKAGGSLDKGLEAAINSILEIRRMKKEREALIHENILDSYLVFFFFIGIIVTMAIFLIPFLQFSLPGNTNIINANEINNLMYILSIIQSVFAGLALGKMYDGRYTSGLKHVLIFLLIVVIVFNILIPMIPKGMNIINITNINI